VPEERCEEAKQFPPRVSAQYWASTSSGIERTVHLLSSGEKAVGRSRDY